MRRVKRTTTLLRRIWYTRYRAPRASCATGVKSNARGNWRARARERRTILPFRRPFCSPGRGEAGSPINVITLYTRTHLVGRSRALFRSDPGRALSAPHGALSGLVFRADTERHDDGYTGSAVGVLGERVPVCDTRCTMTTMITITTVIIV